MELDKEIEATKKKLEELQKKKTIETTEENDLRILEFYKRGYCPGTKVKCASSHYGGPRTLRCNKIKVVNTNQIWCDGIVIYNGHRWAEIIEQSPLVLEEFTVEARDGKAFINGNYYKIEELEMLSTFMKTHNNQVKFISCGCNTDKLINVPVSVIDDILNLVKTQKTLEENRKNAIIPDQVVVIKSKVSDKFWWYNYCANAVFSVRQANQSNFTDVEFVNNESRTPADYWVVTDKNSDYYGNLIFKEDCRLLNFSNK